MKGTMRCITMWMFIPIIIQVTPIVVVAAVGGLDETCSLGPISCPSIFTAMHGADIQLVPKRLQAGPIQQLFPADTIHMTCAYPACLSSPCLNGGLCLETIHGFNCTCLDPYIGSQCSEESMPLTSGKTDTRQNKSNATTQPSTPTSIRVSTNMRSTSASATSTRGSRDIPFTTSPELSNLWGKEIPSSTLAKLDIRPTTSTRGSTEMQLSTTAPAISTRGSTEMQSTTAPAASTRGSTEMPSTTAPAASTEGSTDEESFGPSQQTTQTTPAGSMSTRNATANKACLLDDPTAKTYRGTISQTLTGRTCQKWTEQSPHGHSRTPDNYPTAGLGDHNYCRNPDNECAAWCYTTDPDERLDYCSVASRDPSCQHLLEEISTDCDANDPMGAMYRGNLSTTVSGHTCQKWTEQTPHDHSWTPERYPYSGLGDHNFCRNPDCEDGAWCYTTDPDERSEYCAVGRKNPNCP